MMYLYAISHRKLPAHQQAIQAGHAQLEYVRQNGIPPEHPVFIWLTVSSKMDLLLVETMLESQGVKTCEFHDPDYNGYDPSAIACMLGEDQRNLLSDLPLWKCALAKREGWLIKFFKKLQRRGSLSQDDMLMEANKSELAVRVNG